MGAPSSLGKQDAIDFCVSAIVGGTLGLMIVAGIWFSWNSTPNGIAAGASGGVDAERSQSEIRQVPISEDVKKIETSLKKIGLAFLNFESAFKRFFPAQKTELSWRVHLLPFLEQQPLYNQFHLDEPWDSPHNKTLLDKMPDIYRIGNSKEPTTRYQTITGPNSLFSDVAQARFSALTDGVSHTILVTVTGTDKQVEWTKPDDLQLDPTAPIKSLGKLPDQLVMSVLADSSTLFLDASFDSKDFLALCTPGGNEIIDAATFRRQFEEGRGKVLSEFKGDKGSASSPNKITTDRLKRRNKLRYIALACLNYESAYKKLPIAGGGAGFSADGKPNLSWRVHLLPFLEQAPLYSQFKLDEPWDSPNNIKLIDKMPDVFRDLSDKIDSNKTRIVRLTGPETPFNSPKGPSLQKIADGQSNTILFVMVSADKALDWTRPDDIPFDANAPLECLGSFERGPIQAAFMDGSTAELTKSIPPDVFKAMVTHASGEVYTMENIDYIIR